MPKRDVPASEWFIEAERWSLSFLILSENEAFKLSIVETAVTVAAFAAECYLKALLTLEDKEPEYTHNLKRLFDSLSPESKKDIERWWNRSSLPLALQLNSQRGPGIPQIKSLGAALDFGKNAFEDFRYAEPGRAHGYNLYYFPVCVRTRILQVRPDWIPINPAPNSGLNPHASFIEGEDERFDFITEAKPELEKEPWPLKTTIHIKSADRNDGGAN